MSRKRKSSIGVFEMKLTKERLEEIRNQFGISLMQPISYDSGILAGMLTLNGVGFVMDSKKAIPELLAYINFLESELKKLNQLGEK
jgi:hypothetical protein